MSEVKVERIKAVIALLAERLAADGMSAEISAKHGGRPIRLTGDEGNPIAEIPMVLAELLVSEHVSQADTVLICAWLDQSGEANRVKHFAVGREAGKQEVCAVVHQLLGIDQLVQAIANARGA
jgi:hypothetical protein